MSLRARVNELDIGPHSGLRSKCLVSIIARDIEAIVPVTALTEEATWTPLPVTGRRFFPQTPCIWIDQLPTGGGEVSGQIRFRVIGYNRFGEQIRTTTPWGTFNNTLSNYFYLAEVFHLVTSVEFECDASGVLDPAATISVGVFPNFQRTEDASNHYVWGDNMGIGLPLQTSQINRARFARVYDPILMVWTESYTSEAPFDVRALHVMNHTSGVFWRIADNIVVGRVASGFPPEPNKVTILTFGSVTNEVSGAAAAYAFTDALQVSVLMHSTKTRIAGQRLNDIPIPY